MTQKPAVGSFSARGDYLAIMVVPLGAWNVSMADHTVEQRGRIMKLLEDAEELAEQIGDGPTAI
jgi:hypothetical protein